MFSELALGSCGPDGVLKIDKNIPLYENIRLKSPAASRKLTSAASCPAFTRQRSTVTVGSYAQSETRCNELSLPKTYITKKGDLLLFAIIDNELFALIDSANKSEKKSIKDNTDFDIQPEMLSQYGSLEEFVLAILEYSHKKEKYLYASAAEKISQLITKAKSKGKIERIASVANQRNGEPKVYINKVTSLQNQRYKPGSGDLDIQVTADRSVPISVENEAQEDKPNCKPQLENEHEFDRLALPEKHTSKLRGKLRSPLLERKINSHRSAEELRDKEYLNFAIRMDRKSPDGLIMSNFVKVDPKTLDHVGDDNRKEFLFSISNLSPHNSNNKNFNDFFKETLRSQKDCRTDSSSLKHINDSDIRTKSVLNGNSEAQGNTILPFVFDSKRVMKRGRSAVVGSRQSPAMHSIYVQRSFSHQDLKNLNPRISSARPVPEMRALGMTPSAITLSSEELSRMLEYSSTNRFTIKFPNYSNHLPSSFDHKQYLSNQTALLPGLDSVEDWQTESDLHHKKLGPSVMGDFVPLLLRGSSLCNTEADERLGSDFYGNEVLDRPESHKDSLNSFLLEGTEDDEDKILFSYISPGLRKGSWNPTVSFSFESSSRENSKGEAFSKESTFTREMKNQKDERYLMEDKLVEDGVISTYLSPGEKEISDMENNIFNDNFTLNAKQSNFVTEFDTTEVNDEDKQGHQLSPSKQSLENNHQDLSSLCFIDNVDNIHEVDRGRSISPKTDKQHTVESINMSRSMSKETNNSLFDEVAYEQELIYGQIAKVSEKTDSQQDPGEKRVFFSAKKDVLSYDGGVPSELDIDAISVNNVKQDFCIVDRKSSFSSNTATNISVRHSVANEENLVYKIVLEDERVSNNSDHTVASNGTAQPQVWVGTESSSDRSLFENSGEKRNTNDTSRNEEIKQTADSSVKVKERFQDNVVTGGLNIQQNSKMHTDPISTELKKTQQSLYLDESVFTAKQLLGTEVEACNVKTVKKPNTMLMNNFMPQKSVDGYEVLLEDEPVEPILEEGVKDMTKMSSFTKLAREKGHDKTAKQKTEKKTSDKQEKQTVELQIDLNVTMDSSPDNHSNDARKSLASFQSSEKDTLIADKDSLRLDGVGGNDDMTLEDLKSLVQQNKVMDEPLKSKKKQTDRTSMKRGVSKQKKKKGIPPRQGSISKKGPDSKNFSPLLDLPKKMETVETMIGRPKHSDHLTKASPETEPETAIEKEVTFENQLEIKESTRNVAVKNVEVNKVSEIDPEKKGAYPPSKTKRGAKKGTKKGVNNSKEQEKLKYEEQMRLLKEKEIEQQRAREAALAKQKILEEEREKYKEDEEEAKKMEEEARRKLAEAKQKAKEEREAKRLADAEKRRLLVEQRREERRQKDLELAEKEKEAERLKFERERRAQELKEQRERLQEQERLEEEQMLKNERLEELKREEEEKQLEEEKIKRAQEELERLVEEREYREQLRRVAEAQEMKMRESEEQRRLQEEREQQKIAEERERIKRIEYLKLQAELERQKEAENLAAERRQLMLAKAAKRKVELIKRREENLERMSDLNFKRHSQSISRSFTFTYFVHIPRSVWEMPIGWNSKKAKGGRGGKTRPFSVAANMRGSK